MTVSTRARLILAAAALIAVLVMTGCRTSPPEFQREHIYDTAVAPDDALVDVNVAFNRWPDATTLESAVEDIFRLEGVTDASGEDKALALWKWFRILVSSTGGGYVFEGEDPGRPVTDPHKIFVVYGHHQCDGLSWAMTALWRAGGYIAIDHCHWGHTVAALRYKDSDGNYRYHDFDPQARYYFWDEENEWVSTWTNPVMRARVHRHVMQPQETHSGHMTLRPGETRLRSWANQGHIVPSGRDKRAALEREYYRHPFAPDANTMDKIVGEEIQTLAADMTNAYSGSNVTTTDGLIHPKEAGKPATIVWRMARPNVVADASIAAELASAENDICRLLISLDGETWLPVYDQHEPGEQALDMNIGLDAWKVDLPNVYTAYTFYVKAKLRATDEPQSVGIRNLTLTGGRMLNQRTLPHLRPGDNVVRVTYERNDAHPEAKDLHPEVEIIYSVNGERFRVVRRATRSPYYFRITVPEVEEDVVSNYDFHWNQGALRMESIRITATDAPEHPATDENILPDDEGEAAFRVASPHPADMTRRRAVETPETDLRQTSGFFPQAGPGNMEPDERMEELIELLNEGEPAAHGGWRLGRQWMAAEDLGDYPDAMDKLIEILPVANLDLTVFVCKALARNPHPRMIGPLLDKWEEAPDESPGTRYIPDVLAAIGDRRVVPALVAKLDEVRFDHRLHITRALGILGGRRARAALRHLAEEDPFPAIREKAQRYLDEAAD